MTGNEAAFEEAIADELFGPPRGSAAPWASAGSEVVRPLATQLGLRRKADRWARRWRVASRTEAGRRYTVGRTAAGEWGCSCPVWIYTRARCWHIEQVKILQNS